MKTYQLVQFTKGIMCILTAALLLPSPTYGAPEDLDQTGSVSVEAGDGSGIVDPENPDDGGNPGEGPSTKGPLRIDFVSSLDFGRVNRGESDRTYQAFAQQFQGETGPRGSYIQITDQRTVSTGWTLQVKQNHQFRNPVIQESKEQELQGAVLSLDKAWANSISTTDAPTVTRETVALNGIGAAYELATAKAGSGRGVWTIAFGASADNSNQQENTLTPVVDKEGVPVLDDFLGKQAYRNSAITLTMPERTTIHPVQYETEITWILAALP